MSEKGLAEHYKVLKQFLVISDDLSTRTKTNSTRAARAREKLLKLSSAQFRELSTDVYDELKRRIDESRGEPDYLLPKSTFHPKRNQARQKLSSLPQSRFKDLVSDISFEIERRDLHHVTTTDINNSNHYASSDNNKSLNQGAQENGREIENSNNIHENNNEHINKGDLEKDEEVKNSAKRSNSSELLNQTIGVQPKTVIPTKANLTWSSDEENDDDQPEINSLDILVDGDRAVNRSLDNQSDRSLNQKGPDLNGTISELRNRLENIEYEKMQLQEKYDLLKSDYEYSASQNKTLSDEMENLSEEKNSWLKNKSDYERELKTLQSEASSRSINEAKNNDLLLELENLKAANASLRLENHSLKITSPREVVTSREAATSPQRSIASTRETPAFTSLNALNEISSTSPQRSDATSKDISLNLSSHTSNDVKKDMELFFEKLSDLDSAAVKSKNKTPLPDNNAALWQGRYETLRSNQISSSLKKSVLSRNELKMLITPSGLISMKLVTDLQALVESFLLNINDPNPVPDVLFDKISKISLLGNEIANQGDKQHLNSNENSICLREAVSYALTATRYYAIFSDILPKIVVEQSLGEVCFTVCELVSVSKLNENSTDTRNIYQEPIHALNEKARYDESNAGDSDINTAVRPLKMASKLREYQNQSFNSAEKEVESSSTPTKGLDENSIIDPLNVTPTKNRELAQPKTNHLDSAYASQSNDLSPVRRGIIPTEFASTQGLLNKPNPSPKSRNISALASKFESSNDIPEETVLSNSYSPLSKKQSNSNLSYSESKEIDPNVISNKMNATPTKRSNILDRVKQFDSPTNERLNNYKSKINSPTNDQNNILTNSDMDQSQVNELNEDVNNSFLVSRSSLEIRQQGQEDRSDSALSSPRLDKVNENESIDSKVNTGAAVTGAAAAAAGTAFAGSRSKGLFQSIRNRIAPGSDKNLTADINNEEKSNASTDSKGMPDAEINSPNTSNDTASNLPELNTELESKSIVSDNAYDASTVDVLLQNNKSDGTEIETAKPKSFDDAKTNGNLYNAPQERDTNMNLSNASNKEPVKRGVNFVNDVNTTQVSDEESISGSESDDNEHPEEAQARQRQEYRKSMAAATFNVDLFDIDDPDNTLTQVLLYLEHQTVQVISTIQSLLSAIKKPSATRGDLRQKSIAITEVISQMTEATNTSMNQTRNAQLKEHGSWVVKSLDDCNHRMNILCKPNADKSDSDFADKNFKQRLAGISFDIAKCTKELVKTVEEASLKEDIANIDARLSQTDDLT
ncbi:uncharacterized protein AC631_01429 [Debaryomyces fabryi]|uniref:GIT Spa2 homology (SHD) domain-containing protein n=1 Tax=Debaryomyces fabryi TaxID=58627 RepID=A0A0V1Q2X0_9ASCO|nr:uncharacterized protein AC631_01429 [Debaryomyces fabryi]KSA02832.1 hypothetical protein AC631_01429 [Debaryomyces fabryi]CUM46125.1 unnamed protein product [Debaryomyces fabryi]